MNVVDVELKTGLTRANIRFYEEEKLIQIARDEKGCLDYTDETVDTLLKIKLLRYLKISTEEIRKLQQGEMELKKVLHQQMQDLSEDNWEKAVLLEVCKHMYEEDSTYETLQAKKYLDELAQKQRNQKENARTTSVGLEGDVIQEDSYPWRRLWARAVDYEIYVFLFYVVYYLIAGNKPNYSILFRIGTLLVATVLMFIVEPVLLSACGTTPGKWMLGISITREEGGKLSYRDAFWRTVKMFQYGLGYHLPLYSLYCYWCSGRDLQNGQMLSWDKQYNCRYQVRRGKVLRWIVYAIVAVALLAGETAILSYAELPRNKGTISLEEFTENYNDYLAYNMPDYYAVSRLNREGRWCKVEGRKVKEDAYEPEYIESTPEGNYLSCAKFIYTEEDDVLKEISLHYELKDQEFMGDYNGELHCAILAYACAQPGMGFGEMKEIEEEVISQLEDGDVDFTYSIRNVVISCKIENNLSDFYSIDFSMKTKRNCS